MVLQDHVNIALALHRAHVWDPTTKLCTCGEFFEAIGLERNGHPEHVMRKVLESHEIITGKATPPANAWVTEQRHEGCVVCEDLVEQAISMAKVTGSIGATQEIRDPKLTVLANDDVVHSGRATRA